MLYKKNAEKALSAELFENPTSEYRATPFWSWNCKLSEDLLRRQIGYLQEMGFGGFHMHSRVGMSSEYLGEEFMANVRACVDEAEKRNMLAWLYDEDKWPSGFAGGYVTKIPKYRQRFVAFAPAGGDVPAFLPMEEAIEKGEAYYITSYDIVLNDDGTLRSYTQIAADAMAQGDKWVVYCAVPAKRGWHNGYTYADLFNKEAVDKFIEITYEAYKKEVGDKFGDLVPAIFTDEPQFNRKQTLPYATSKEQVTLPWTPLLPEKFKDYTGEDVLEKLPELFWDLPAGKVSRFRYLYHDFIAELFTSTYVDTCGKWCKENGLMFTGHMNEEPSLMSQTAAIGEAMRNYRSFQLPGIDMLCGWREYTTAKQAQSAAHQYGAEGVLSELYGVTNWDFDFRGHKLHGDWQAALGISVRVPHLSWVSMAGEAKRDYPASINYQSPWYKEYKYVEDHFARVNTALTRGKPSVKVGVLHPVESYWLHWGPSENTSDIRAVMQEQFDNCIEWLLFGTIDFDYICESQLPQTFGGCADGKFNVGKMGYSAILVPNMETMRQTTLDALKKFKAAGGKIIFAGACPKYIDAIESDGALSLYNECTGVGFERLAILNALTDERDIEIRNARGEKTDSLLYNMREEENGKWLFIARGRETYGDRVEHRKFNDINAPETENVQIKIKGHYTPVLYNTLSGETEKIRYSYNSDCTVVYQKMYSESSLLLWLENGKSDAYTKEELAREGKEIILRGKHDYTLDEPNVLLLDMAEFALDDGAFEPEEEILRLDTICRKRIGIENKADMPQPWVFDDKDSGHTITLRIRINSEIEVEGAHLAVEDAEKHEFTFNDAPIEARIDGYFTDESIKTFPLPKLKVGENILTIKLKLSIRSNTEWCYLLGDFGVKVEGTECTIIPRANKIGYGPLMMQTMPFYGGNVTYKNEIETPDCNLQIRATTYKGAVVKVFVDGKDCGYCAFAPYTVDVKDVKAGKHTIEFKLFGNRYNSFAALHNNNTSQTWFGPTVWRTAGDEYSYEYQLKDMGILAAPIVKIIEK